MKAHNMYGIRCLGSFNKGQLFDALRVRTKS